MKKSISFLLIAAMVASVPLFAEINFGFWGRGVWTPFAIQEEAAADDAGKDVAGTTSSIGPAWEGLSNARVGVDIKGQDDGGNYGFQLGIKSVLDKVITPSGSEDLNIGDVISINDNAYVWISPFNGLKFNLGKFNIDPLRGGAYRANEWLDISGIEYGFWEDALFSRFKQNGGVLFEYTGVENLYAGVALGVVGEGKYISNYETDPTSADGWKHDANGDRIPIYHEYGPFYVNGFGDIFAQGRYAVGYTFPNIARAKVQFQGGARATPVPGQGGRHADEVGLTPYSWVQVGADVYAVPGVAIEVGVTIPFAYEKEIDIGSQKTESGVKIGLGAKATLIDALTLAGSFGFQFGDKVTREADADHYDYEEDYTPVTSGLVFTANIEADYAITPILSAGLGFGLKAVGNTDGKKPGTKDADDSGYVAANLGVNLGVKVGSGAYLGIGVAIKDLIHAPNGLFDPSKDEKDPVNKDTVARKPVIAIPIGFSFGL